MADRIIALFFIDFVNQVITIPFAQSTDDHEEGNEFHSFKGRLSSIFIFFFCMIYHVIYYIGDPLHVSDYFTLGMIIAGAILRLWAFKEMGRFFTYSIGIQENHELVTTGPYRIFSHPGYIGQFLILMGFTIFCRLNIYLFMLLLIYILLRFRHRIIAEETMLREHFGADYKFYKRNVFLF